MQMRKIAAAMLVLASVGIAVSATDVDVRALRQRQRDAHEMAEAARRLGMAESDPIILRAQEIYMAAEAELPTEPQYTADELTLLATLVYYEAGSDGCTDEHQQLTAMAALNRVADKRFPDSLREVICQKNYWNDRWVYQYNPWYAEGDHSDIYETERFRRAAANARLALEGKVDCPPDMVWQAEFVQGSEVFEICYDDVCGSTTYFCCG